VRAAIEDLAGSPVTQAVSQGGGFTSGFASRLLLAGGSRLFVKAAERTLTPVAHPSYVQEAAVVAALPVEVPAPRPLWSVHVGEWFVLALEDVEARVPMRPWDPAELDRVLDAMTRTARALTPVPASLGEIDDVSAYSEDFRFWRKRAASDEGAIDVEVPALWLAHEDLLVGLESEWLAHASGVTAAHFDVRDDNVLIAEDGRVLLCDWNWLTRAASWADLTSVLVSAWGDGLDATAIWRRQPLADGVSDRALDSVLAAIGGFYAERCAEPEWPASPFLRAHQRWYRDATLGWLAERLHLAT
jgi:hypothetical protein